MNCLLVGNTKGEIGSQTKCFLLHRKPKVVNIITTLRVPHNYFVCLKTLLFNKCYSNYLPHVLVPTALAI